MRIRTLFGALVVALSIPAWAQSAGQEPAQQPGTQPTTQPRGTQVSGAKADPSVVVPQVEPGPSQNPQLRRSLPEVVRVDPPQVVGRENFQKREAGGPNDPIQVREDFNPELRRSVQQVQ